MERDTAFISHSSSDNDFARRLASDMKKHGLSVWLDLLDIAPSADWNASIQDALAKSSQLLVVWSEASVRSTEVLLEAVQAKLEGKVILQVMIDDCKRPAQFDRFQNIDFRKNYDEALERLLEFMPTVRRTQRLKELAEILPASPYPRVPRMTK